MSVRTYNPSVRVGNWNEDITLEEDTLKDFLDRKDKNELLIQKSSHLKDSILQKVDLSISRDGQVHFGDVVMLMNAETKERSCSTLCMNMSIHTACGPIGVTSSKNVEPCARATFVITSLDGSAVGEPLRYNQSFYLRTASQGLYLYSDRATFFKSAKKSRHQEVSLVTEPSHQTEWIIKSYDPQYRMELEHTPVLANRKIVFTHVKTNNNLHLEVDHTVRTQFGREYEVSAHTDLDSHKAEKDTDHWMLLMNVPGDNIRSVEAPPAN